MSALISDWIKNVKTSTSGANLAAEQCLDSIKEYFHCTICRDNLVKPIQTKCGHIFCSKCIQDLCKTPAANCPLCKVRISNRSLIVREDVDEMMNILMNKLSKVFTNELGKYLNWKDGKCKKYSTPIMTVKAIEDVPKASSSSKTTYRKEKAGITVADGHEVLFVSQNETSSGNQITSCHPPGELEAQKSKELTKVAKLEEMRNQEYVIMSTGIEVTPAVGSQSPMRPLDLSLTRRRSSRKKEYTYTAKPTAIRYIKPLDLSMKQEKRKFEDLEENCVVGGSKNSRILPSEPPVAPPPHHSPQRKRGKYEDKNSKPKGDHSSSSLKQSTSKAKVAPVLEHVELENCYEDEDQPIIFTPTPPPAVKNDTPAKQNDENEFIQKTEPAKKVAGPSQSYISSAIMKDFDMSFEEDDMVVNNISSGGKVTSSDELLSTITDESLLCVNGKSQAKSVKRQVDAEEKIQEKETFAFKQPSGSLSIAPAAKKKHRTAEEVFLDDDDDDDDEFQRPRDSDYLFRDLSLSGISGKGKNVERDNNTNSNRRLSGGPDKEKENIGRRSLSRRGNCRTPTSPVKSKPSTSSEANKNEDTTDKFKSKSQKQVPKTGDEDMFEDGSDDEDWLLGIPLESQVRSTGKRSSGKLEQPKDPQAMSLVKMPQTARTAQPKQRYVFCPTRLSKQQTIKLQDLCKMCDGIITKDFTLEVSHLVINLANGRVPQTLKYLLAIAGRKWVVIYDWVEKCLEEGELVSEAPFETSNFKQCDPGVKRSRLAKRNLFDNYKFYFATEHYRTMGFTKDEVMQLMDTLGATVVTSPHDKFRDLIIIGSLNGNFTDYNHWLHTNKWVTVTFEWVIECILEYQLKPFEAKHLCGNLTAAKSINAPKPLQTVFSQYLTQRQINSPI